MLVLVSLLTCFMYLLRLSLKQLKLNLLDLNLNQKAYEYFADKLKPKTSDDDIDINDLFGIKSPVKAREKVLDELGEYNLSKGADLDKPVLGVHDVYSDYEAAVRGLDNLGIVGAAVDEVRIARNIDSVYGRV